MKHHVNGSDRVSGTYRITEMSVPVSKLVIFLIATAVLGLIAAGWPARQAAKLDVLSAIATE
jgi:ABC-type lipoprotein release transport system permease subunit